MASMASRPSKVFVTDAERRERLRRDTALREFYMRNDQVYVGELAFNRCWATIKPWINIQSLMGHLMRNGLVNSSDDMDEISSVYLPAAKKDANLKRLLQANGGGNGYFIFYMSLCESLESNPLGHGDAVDELKRCALDCNEVPPWDREVNRTTSYPFSTSSYTSLTSTDTSSEMGPQSLPSSNFPSLNLPSTTLPTSTPGSSTIHLTTSMDSPSPLPPPSRSNGSSTSTTNTGESLTPSSSSSSSEAGGQSTLPPPSSSAQPSQQSSQFQQSTQGGASSSSSQSSESAAHLMPRYRSKNEFSQTSTVTSRHQLIYQGSGRNFNNLETTSSTSGASVLQGNAVKLVSGITPHSFSPFNKGGYTSNDSYSGEGCFFTPQEEMNRWTSFSTATDDTDIDKDGGGRPHPLLGSQLHPSHVSHDGRSPQPPSATSEAIGAEGSDTTISQKVIENFVSNGYIDKLSDNYDDKIDLYVSTEGNSSDFIDSLCRFVCAVLNTRDSKKVGVFLGGVREPESEKETYCVEGVKFDVNGMRAIEQRYRQKLHTVLHARIDEKEHRLTQEELELVQLKFVEINRTSDDRKCHVALITVNPNMAVCKNHMYVCQFRDQNGRAQSECYKRLEGETVHIRQQKKITALKNLLNQF